MRCFISQQTEPEVCKVRVKSQIPREKPASNGHVKLKVSEVESIGEPYLAAISPQSQGQGLKRCVSLNELEVLKVR